jgi:uncharacterized protein YdhG (YjbR/CyaY superfamily)
MKPVQNVDEYIAGAPENVQGKLRELRQAIKKCAPEAVERISYGMPFYEYYGRLAYFGYAKEHIGLYFTPPIIEKHKEELKGYKTAKATIRFPNKEKLPIRLIKKLIRARMKMNEKTKGI